MEYWIVFCPSNPPRRDPKSFTRLNSVQNQELSQKPRIKEESEPEVIIEYGIIIRKTSLFPHG
jgi:hypothetical protein